MHGVYSPSVDPLWDVAIWLFLGVVLLFMFWRK